MGRLVYSSLTSLDGYVADDDGAFDWAAPGEDVHAAVNDVVRPFGTHLYGRRMYEVMTAWETMDVTDESPATVDFAAIWAAADKVVVSSTLDAATTTRTRIERTFDPDAVRALTATSDVLVGGPTLAAEALRAGLVDEVHQFVSPVVVGGGLPCWPPGVAVDLELVGVRRFDDGVVHLHHRIR